jgi:hypothetical protein
MSFDLIVNVLILYHLYLLESHGGRYMDQMEMCLDHDHPVFDDDNHAIFDMLHDLLQGTTFGATINPYKKKKDGRKAWLALLNQHAGQDCWDAEVKRENAYGSCDAISMP